MRASTALLSLFLTIGLLLEEGHATKGNVKPSSPIKNYADWEVIQLDPRGGSPLFVNDHMKPEYASYNPPDGYTAEEIMKFRDAVVVLKTVQAAEKILEAKKKHGTLDLE